MSLWLLVPRDPLIFRDGKPFTAVPGERSKSMLFPFPATLAGAVRTRTATDVNTGKFNEERIPELKNIKVRGPVLVELDDKDQVKDWFFPAPADALLVQTQDMTMRHSLLPLNTPNNALSDLGGKALVGPLQNIKDKPLAHPPRYWKWKQIESWLMKQVDGRVQLDELGIQGPERETRTHVSIDPESQSAAPGALFQTSGMEFVQLEREKDEAPELNKARSLALALATEAGLVEGVDFLGGERRVIRWEKADAKVSLPGCPASVKDEIVKQGHCRLILANPASFNLGYLPSWLKNEYKVEVIAAALPRYQTISGWDYEIGKPKRTRRLAPAGSVYFLEFKSNNKNDIEKFVDAVWLQAVSDDEQSRTDGFGLALLGTWDGSLRTMEVQ
jgi:CRISPR-associated protein Cmr3